jgi:hypothetical protein
LTYTTVDDKIPTKYRQLLPSRLGQSTSLLMVYVLSLSVVAMDFAIPYHMKHKTGETKKKLQIIIHVVDATLKQAFHTASTALITLSDPVE